MPKKWKEMLATTSSVTGQGCCKDTSYRTLLYLHTIRVSLVTETLYSKTHPHLVLVTFNGQLSLSKIGDTNPQSGPSYYIQMWADSLLSPTAAIKLVNDLPDRMCGTYSFKF